MTYLSNHAVHKNKDKDYKHAKKMRRSPTDGEDILWYELRKISKAYPFRFRRQHPLHPYIVDFVSLKLCLVIEVDGSSHDNRIKKDERRDTHLNQMGYRILRYTNTDVVKHRESVLEDVIKIAMQILNGNIQPRP